MIYNIAVMSASKEDNTQFIVSLMQKEQVPSNDVDLFNIELMSEDDDKIKCLF